MSVAVNGVDESVWRFFVDHRTSALTSLFEAVTTYANPLTVIVLVAGLAIVLMARQHRRLAGRLVIASSATWLTTTVIKVVVARPRPPLTDRLITVGEYSFPSGHASQSVAYTGSLAVIAIIVVGYRRWLRAAVVIVAVGLMALIGVSRLYLGVHWLSDVVVGWLIGAGWLVAVWGPTILRVNSASPTV